MPQEQTMHPITSSVITWRSQDGKETPLNELYTYHLRNIVGKLLQTDSVEPFLYRDAVELTNKGLAEEMCNKDLHLFILLGHLAERQLWAKKRSAIELTEEEKQDIADKAIEAEMKKRRSEIRTDFHIASQLG